MSNEKISFTETEVAELTGLRLKTLQRWRSLNQGPHFVRLGRCVGYPAQELRLWITSQPGGGCEVATLSGSKNVESHSKRTERTSGREANHTAFDSRSRRNSIGDHRGQ